MSTKLDFCLTVSLFGLPPLHVRTLPPKSRKPRADTVFYYPFLSIYCFCRFLAKWRCKGISEPLAENFSSAFCTYKTLKIDIITLRLGRPRLLRTYLILDFAPICDRK